MKNQQESTRRKFLKTFATTAAVVGVGSNVFASNTNNNYFETLKRHGISPNDNINIALIGAGGMGTQDTLTALKVPGIKLVAICDLYDGRLEDAKKKWGAELFGFFIAQR